MTLDELRDALERDQLGTSSAQLVDASAIRSKLARQLREVATSHQRGLRLRLPQNMMPVLP
ncbi:hypothetical protein [Trinickia dinghuensis]|uniref:Uncharacterized protein n=1 Tax=Trinickia dinghuensis TaxID=2291023 RepID=A0A3D8K172_9BURK|nr:hypothetical protein [Trinickia dinghuensis]RDU99183.1 hypothetical protein DWV00_08640 [Trinickia dinghuensis]